MARALLDKETTLPSELIVAIPFVFWMLASISYSLFLEIPPEYSTIVVSNMEVLDKMVVTHSDYFVKYAEHVHCEL